MRKCAILLACVVLGGVVVDMARADEKEGYRENRKLWNYFAINEPARLPTNDPAIPCDGTYTIDCAGGPYLISGDLAGAGDDCYQQSGEDQSWELVITEGGKYTFDMCVNAPGGLVCDPDAPDTVLDLTDDECCGYSILASDDDTCAQAIGACYGLSSIENVSLSAGTYYLSVDSYSFAVPGPYVITITCEAAGAGDDCSNPLPVMDAFDDNGQTNCGRGDNYDTGTCLGYWDNGEDILYEWTVTSDACFNITLTPDTTYAGIYVDNECPDVDENCIASGTNYGSTDPIDLSGVNLTAGTYYIQVDTWSSPDCINSFDLHVELCPAGGACCHPDGSCTDEPNAGSCTGVYQGDGTSCATTFCPTEGDDCSNPLAVADVFSDVGQTNCGRGDLYEDTCLDYYDSGEEIIYEWTVNTAGCFTLTLDPKGTTYSGLAVDDACPLDGTTCLATSTNSGSDPHTLTVDLSAGTYYIQVDTWSTPDCIADFDLTVGGCAIGRCCYYNGGTNCADITEPACDALGGSWDETKDCTNDPCPEPPSNDDCADATNIGSVPFDDLDIVWALATDDDNVDPSCDSSISCLTGAGWGLWYTYTPTEDCMATLDREYTGGDYVDTAVSLWTGPDCNSLTEFDCVDSESAEVSLTGGTTYWILISKWSCYDPPEENLDFFFDCLAPPENDDCPHATAVSCGTFLDDETNQYATDDYDASGCTPYSSLGPDVVYSLTLPFAATVTVTMDDQSFDNSLYVVTDCDDIGGTCVAGADDNLSGVGETVVFDGAAGVTYYIIADKYGSGGGGTFDLTVACIFPTGACCDRSTGICTDDVLESECQGADDWWFEGQTCAAIPCEAIVRIPTVTEWGLVVMTLLGCALGTILFARRRAVKRA